MEPIGRILRIRILFLAGLALAATAHAADDSRDELAARQARAWVKISMERAIAIACDKIDGAAPYRAVLAMRDEIPAYEVSLILPGGVKVVRVDAESGKILAVTDGRHAAIFWPFDEEKTGAPPPAWSIRQTNPTRALATWEVASDFTAPSKFNALALTATRNIGSTFNLAILDSASFRDLELTVDVKAVRGKEDQGGGPIWRCKDENNYYVCRFNPLEGNYRVYVVREGKRTQLASAQVGTDPDRWYRIGVRMIGSRIECSLDGRKHLQVEDTTFGEAGKVGLWTKADAVTSFDDLAVREIEKGERARTQDAR